MKELVINSTIQHTLLLFVPLAFALVLRIARVRAWSILGGVIGGVLLGPAIFGSIAPTYWEGLFRGGMQEQENYRQLERQQESDVAAATTLGVSEAYLLQMEATQQYQLVEPMEKWIAAQWSDQRTLRDYAIALIIIILLYGNMRQRIKGTAPPLTSLSVGVWAAIVPSGIATCLAFWFWNLNVEHALAFGAVLAVGPWTLRRQEQQVADESFEDGAALMLRCGRVAWLGAILMAIYATWQFQGAMSLVWLVPLLILPTMWLLPSRDWKWLSILVRYAAIPSVMATALVLIHPFKDVSLWLIVIVILLCADGRWLGGILGLGLLGGYNSKDALRLAIPLVDSGISQLCMTALLFGAGVLPAEFALAALVGAVFLEYTAPLRMKLAQSE